MLAINTDIIKNNSKIWQSLLNDHKLNKIPHAYLFNGYEGIGKKTIAKEYIKYILSANEVLSKRIDENSFLDLLIIEKQDKNEITIDQVRKANDFFNQTPAESPYKFVIIDAIDHLNINAANALLKTIEEPTANTYLFLINHVSGKTLSTIRSRCRIVNFTPRYIEHQLQDLIAGSFGKKQIIDKNDALKLYDQMLQIMAEKDIILFNKFSEQVTKDQELWHLTMELIIYLISRCIKVNAKAIDKQTYSECEKFYLDKIAKTKNIDQWFDIDNETRALIRDNEVYNLDKKQLLFIRLFT